MTNEDESAPRRLAEQIRTGKVVVKLGGRLSFASQAGCVDDRPAQAAGASTKSGTRVGGDTPCWPLAQTAGRWMHVTGFDLPAGA